MASRSNTVGSHKTSILIDDNDFTNIVYHNTPVVKFNSKEVILNTGGWFSRTTKVRMNQAARQFMLGYYVFQKAGKWFVEINGTTMEFTSDTIQLMRA